MDEEDGRPGALAAQTGHLDAPSDVPTVSLCRLYPKLTGIASPIGKLTPKDRHPERRAPQLRRSKDLRFIAFAVPQLPVAPPYCRPFGERRGDHRPMSRTIPQQIRRNK